MPNPPKGNLKRENGLGGLVPPQNERVLDRIGVIVPPRGSDVKPEPFVKPAGGLVGGAYFEGGPPGAKVLPFGEDVVHQRRADAAPAVLGPHCDVIDVDL